MSLMSTAMSRIFSFLAMNGLLSLIALSRQNGVQQQSMGGSYPAGGQFYRAGDECADKAMRENRIIDGVSLAPSDPITTQLENIEKRQKCVANKIKMQQDFNRKVNNLIQQTTNEAKKNPEAPEKKRCISKLDRANHECFVKHVLNDFYTSVVWKVAIHDNVAQLWYHDKLVLMVVFEPIEYNIHPEAKECLTFFPVTNIAAEENALGHVVNIVGKPATPYSKTASECRPCTDFLKDNKTIEGKGIQCSNSCDPANLLFSSTNFKVKKAPKSNSATKEKETPEKSKEE